MPKWLSTLPLDGWGVPVFVLAGAILLGLLFDRLVLRWLKKWTGRTAWRYDNVLIGALSHVAFYCFLLGGLYAAFSHSPLDGELLPAAKKITLVLILLVATIAATQIAVGFVTLYIEKNRDVLPPSSIFKNLTRLVVLLLGALVILQSLGISITPILTALGVGGLAVALALQPTLENLFSGLQIILSRQLRPGDYVRLESGEGGYVEDISWRNTTIRTLPNNMIIIPNSKLAGATLTNTHLPGREMAVLVQVGVSYASDLPTVERVTVEVAREVMKAVEGGMKDFEPFVRFHTFGDSSINFTVILRAREFVDQYLLKHEFIKRLHARYARENIEIPFPIRTLYLKNAATDTI